MYISIFRLLLIILSAIIGGMNIFNIMSARANNESTSMPILTFIFMLVLIVGILGTQYMQNRRNDNQSK